MAAPPNNILYGNEPWLLAYDTWMLGLYDGPQGDYWRDRTKNELLTAFHEGFEAGTKWLSDQVTKAGTDTTHKAG